MRDDYKHLLLDTGRAKKAGRRRSRSARRADVHASEGMRADVEPRLQGDRLRPLVRVLRKHVGKSWSATLSRLCASADSRSLRGHHLRQHIDALVDSRCLSDIPVRPWESRSFYVDARGILREYPR